MIITLLVTGKQGTCSFLNFTQEKKWGEKSETFATETSTAIEIRKIDILEVGINNFR